MKPGVKESSYHGGLQRKLLPLIFAFCFLSDSLRSVALLIVHQSNAMAFNLPGNITGLHDSVIYTTTYVCTVQHQGMYYYYMLFRA